VDEAERRVDEVPVGSLPAFIDGLAGHAGDYFLSMAALGGAAYKTEINLARFYGRHLAPRLGGSHLTLLSGLEAPMPPARHAVASIDWWFAPAEPSPTGSPVYAAQPAVDHARLVESRHQAEAAARTVLARSPRRLRAFERALADAQHVAPIREEQAREWTLAWPAMRRAVVRMGQALAGAGVIADPNDVFFLTRSEALDALAGRPANPAPDVGARRATRERQSTLTPPSFVGRVHPFVRTLFDRLAGTVGAVRSEGALVSGTPASPGRATGAVRVVRGPESFGELQPGEVLFAPMTAPARTPLFAHAAAVVTDVGSVAAHASIIAREYGIPAVVGCGDATSRLRDGMLVTVDGTRGNVEPA
jgi:pyruvate,water dikinase